MPLFPQLTGASESPGPDDGLFLSSARLCLYFEKFPVKSSLGLCDSVMLQTQWAGEVREGREGKKKEKQKQKSRSKKRGENLKMKTLPVLRTDDKPVVRLAPGLSAPEPSQTWG